MVVSFMSLQAEARLAQRRQARAEARAIRLRELEKQAREVSRPGIVFGCPIISADTSSVGILGGQKECWPKFPLQRGKTTVTRNVTKSVTTEYKRRQMKRHFKTCLLCQSLFSM